MKRKLEYIKRVVKKPKEDAGESEDEEDNVSLLKKLLNKKIDSVGQHIWLNESINNASISRIVKVIYEKNHEFEKHSSKYEVAEPKPVYLHISSNGGDLMEAMTLIDCIKNSKVPIYTVIDSYGASAATLISIVGKKRYMTENASMLIHQLSSACWGTYEELSDEHANNTFFMERIVKLYVDHTHLKDKQLRKILKHDIWWDLATCLKHGLVDEVYKL